MSGDFTQLKSLIAKVADGDALSRDEAVSAFEIIMSGDATPSQMGGFLMAIRVRGETVEEITGAATVMRAMARHIKAPPTAMDIVGTGGDAAGTFNVSTASALVVAGCGVPVAKHGNRAFSSRSGSADVLAALGVNLDADYDLVEEAIHGAGIGFMMAPRHHSAMRNVGGTRVELGTRTIFNILGPLSNPARVARYLIGVFARHWIEPMAEVLGKLGAEHAWVVHGSDGLDEVTLTGSTFVAELKDGRVTTFEVDPSQAGLNISEAEALSGGDPKESARMMLALLNGEKGPIRDFVCLNSAAALIVAGKAADLMEGVGFAADSLDSGRARAALDRLIQISCRRDDDGE